MKEVTAADNCGRPYRMFAGAALPHPEALSKGHEHAVTGEWVRVSAVWEEVVCMCKCASAMEREVEQEEAEEKGVARSGNESDELMAICPHACP